MKISHQAVGLALLVSAISLSPSRSAAQNSRGGECQGTSSRRSDEDPGRMRRRHSEVLQLGHSGGGAFDFLHDGA